MTKQAARKRFVPKGPGDPSDLDADEGFQRFTARARDAMVVAHDEAQRAGHAEILPAHLVLGLLRDPEGLAARALVATGTTLDTVRGAALAALPPAADDAPALVPYGTEARKVLELTFREALRLGHDYVGTEHVLLALRETEGDGGVLASLGITKAAIDEHVRAVLAQWT